MKKIVLGLIMILFCTSILAGEKIKASEVFNFDAYKKGFSAKIISTSIMAGTKTVTTVRQYVNEDNMRIDNETEKTTQIMKNEGTYFINHASKTYFFMKEGNEETAGILENSPEEQNPLPDVNEIFEKAGTEKFAGVMCDRYKINDSGEMGGTAYIYIDPTKKMTVGSAMKGQGFEMKSEWFEIKFGVDKSVFDIPKGYKKTESMF